MHFTDAVTEVVMQWGATLRLYKLQRESSSAYHVATTRATLARDSSLTSVTIDLGGGLVRHDQTVTLAEGGATARLNGLYVGDGSRHIDNHTMIDHAAPDTTSDEVFKGILDDASHGVFVGQVLVRRDSQRVAAHQMNKNLVLSDDAEVDTQPKLEILADDVQCTHGAAIGRLDASALFYLNARGLGEREARELLVHGFVNEVIGTIEDDAIRQYIDDAVSVGLG
jgi:Fe-S cluster assembly protein SufD